MGQRPLILIVDDERSISNFLRICLSTEDYRTVEAESANQAISLATSYVPDLIILDLGLPDRDGMDVLRQVRAWSHIPIIVLSARDQERDKVEALDLGADDYLTKPFGVDEFLARIRASLRRTAVAGSGGSESTYHCGRLVIDLELREVRREEKPIHLTPIEYRLIAVLARHAGRVVTHNQLLQEVWGPESGQQQQYLRVFMASLRRKIEEEPSHPHYLMTDVGVGYRLVEPEEQTR